MNARMAPRHPGAQRRDGHRKALGGNRASVPWTSGTATASPDLRAVAPNHDSSCSTSEPSIFLRNAAERP
jgi:hypothetical protein